MTDTISLTVLFITNKNVDSRYSCDVHFIISSTTPINLIDYFQIRTQLLALYQADQ